MGKNDHIKNINMIHNVIGLIVYESCSKLKLLSINNAINELYFDSSKIYFNN
jgi:hypothetical protein